MSLFIGVWWLNGSNATPLVSRYSCRTTLCRICRLTFSQCRTRIALHPLKCLKDGPVAPVWGVVARELCTVQMIEWCRGTGVSQLQCFESRYTAPLSLVVGGRLGVLCFRFPLFPMFQETKGSSPLAAYFQQCGPGTEPEPETGTAGTIFPGTETGTVLSVKLY